MNSECVVPSTRSCLRLSTAAGMKYFVQVCLEAQVIYIPGSCDEGLLMWAEKFDRPTIVDHSFKSTWQNEHH